MSVMAIIADIIGRYWGYGTILTNSQNCVLVSLLRILQRPMCRILAHILSHEGDTHMPDLRSFWGCPMIWSLWQTGTKFRLHHEWALFYEMAGKLKKLGPQFTLNTHAEPVQKYTSRASLMNWLFCLLGLVNFMVLPWFVHICTIISCVPG